MPFPGDFTETHSSTPFQSQRLLCFITMCSLLHRRLTCQALSRNDSSLRVLYSIIWEIQTSRKLSQDDREEIRVPWSEQAPWVDPQGCVEVVGGCGCPVTTKMSSIGNEQNFPNCSSRTHSSHQDVSKGVTNDWQDSLEIVGTGTPQVSPQTVRANTHRKSHGPFLNTSLRRDDWLVRTHGYRKIFSVRKSNMSPSWGEYSVCHCCFTQSYTKARFLDQEPPVTKHMPLPWKDWISQSHADSMTGCKLQVRRLGLSFCFLERDKSKTSQFQEKSPCMGCQSGSCPIT